MLGIPEFASLPWLLPGVALSAMLGYVARRLVARWIGGSELLAWAAIVSLGLVVSATLTPRHDGEIVGGTLTAGCDFSRMGPASLTEILKFDEPTLNILLFVPLGVVLAFIPRSRRKAVLIGGAVLAPIIIETTQLLATPLNRACQSADVFDNVTGLLVGLALGSIAAALAMVFRKARATSHSDLRGTPPPPGEPPVQRPGRGGRR